MLCSITCHVTLYYKTCYVMLYKMSCYSMLYKTSFLCDIICYVLLCLLCYVIPCMLYLLHNMLRFFDVI